MQTSNLAELAKYNTQMWSRMVDEGVVDETTGTIAALATEIKTLQRRVRELEARDRSFMRRQFNYC